MPPDNDNDLTTLSENLRTRLGGNNPPGPIPPATAELEERLTRDYAKMIDEFRALEIALTQVPEVLDEPLAKRATDMIGKQCRPLIKSAESAHEKEKKTFLELGRVVDTFFLRRRDAFSASIKKIENRISKFQIAQREAARRAQEQARIEAERVQRAAAEEAEKARKAAEELAKTDRAGAKAALGQAEVAEKAIALAQKTIDAPPATAHIRGDYGALSYVKEEWDYEVTDPSAIPLGYLCINDALVRAEIAKSWKESKARNEAEPSLQIPGLRIYKTETTVIKGR